VIEVETVVVVQRGHVRFKGSGLDARKDMPADVQQACAMIDAADKHMIVGFGYRTVHKQAESYSHGETYYCDLYRYYLE